MGRSRRKLNKFKTKVSLKPKRKPLARSKTPQEITAHRPDVAKKLGVEPTWDAKDKMSNNYTANGFMADPNAGFGRNASSHILKEKAHALEQSAEDADSDDDLRQAEGKPRHDGARAEVPKLTGTQQRVIARLMESHGDDTEAMVRDTKLNQMLLPASKLKRLIAGYKLYGNRGRCSFRVPVKGL